MGLLASSALVAATISGSVKDASGAPVAAATVELRSAAGASFSTKTGASGEFRFADLATGAYQLRVALPGFEPWQADIAADAPPVEIRLAIATLRQQVDVTAARGANADPNYRALRDAALEEPLLVENVMLRRDNGVLTLKSGVLAFTAPVLGRSAEAVFSGDGSFVFQPASAIETDHVRSLIGTELIEEQFDRALFCFTDRTADEIRSQAGKHAADAKLNDTLREFRKHLRYRPEQMRSMTEFLLHSDEMDNVDADILADLYNPAQPGFFSAYLHGRKHADLRFHVRPRGVLPGLPAPEEVAVIHLDPGSDQEGIWYLGHLAREIKGRTASSDENKRVVEAESYRIDTAVAHNDHLTAVATVRFHAVTRGDRLIRFSLLPSLRVARVSTGSREIAFVQEDRKEDGSFYVVMPAPMEPGAAYTVTIEYQGDRVVRNEGGGNFAVGARESWYPNVNAFRDHAHYDLIFRVPKQYTLVSVGKLEKRWTEEGYACSQWVSPAPFAVAGFNFGDFKEHDVHDSQLDFTIEGYAANGVPDYLRGAEGIGAIGSLTPARLMDNTIVDAQNALRIYNAWFGKPEYGRIAITQQPQFNFGQSWPTLVYLPFVAYLDDTQRWRLMGQIQNRLTEFVEEVTPHEVSHQWWGHEVGWTTYHDQWLSEGFATFSAGLFLQFTEKNLDKYLNYWVQARRTLVEKNNYGQRAIDAGPLWLGLRLATPKNERAYQSVVYYKGAYILHMLRSMMYESQEGDKRFIAMMHDFVDENLNRNASTETFQHAVEKHMRPAMNLVHDGKMDWFFREWVYGAALPHYKFDYDVTPAGDGFVLHGSLTQSEVTPDFTMLVPMYIDFSGPLVRLGLVRVTGNSTVEISQIKLPSKPRRVLINAFHDILEQ
jgi:hypothetical protein